LVISTGGHALRAFFNVLAAARAVAAGTSAPFIDNAPNPVLARTT
jgi:hypothetical protein